MRAQAVDMYLKENSGIIEAYHDRTDSPGNYGAVGFPDIDHESHLSVIGHVTPYLPNNEYYQKAKEAADEDAKEAILSILDHSLNTTTAGNEILTNFDKGNICIQVKPLPYESTDGVTIDFSCETPKGKIVQAKNVRVTPVKGSKGKYNEGLNRQMIFDPDASIEGDELIHEVVNVVFIGVAYEHRHFLEGLFPQMGSNIQNYGVKNGWAIAYPQIDKCFGVHCAKYEND